MAIQKTESEIAEYITNRIEENKGIWSMYSSKKLAETIYTWLVRICGTFEEEEMGFLAQLDESILTNEESCTGKYPWYDKELMEEYPLDIQEWARMKRIDDRMWQWEHIMEKNALLSRRFVIP
jgi:hypothetical protein